MSTHAIITSKRNPSLGIYLHFDGYSKEMVEEIVNIAKNDNARNVNLDESYGIARLACACEKYFKNQETGFGIIIVNEFTDYEYHWTIDEYWNVEEFKE